MSKDELLDIAGRLVAHANSLDNYNYEPLDDGGEKVTIEHLGLKWLVTSLWQTYETENPPNYLVMVVGHPGARRMEVTLRPLDGDRRTPSMDVAMLKHRVGELEAQLAEATKPRDCDHSFRPLQNFYGKVCGQMCIKCGEREVCGA